MTSLVRAARERSDREPPACRHITTRHHDAIVIIWTPTPPSRTVDSRFIAGFAPAIAPMLQIITVIRPHLADDVLDALRRAPVEAVTVQEVKGYGRQKSYLDQYQPNEYDAAFIPKVEITLWVDPARSEEVIEKLTAVARSGRIGDGKIMVLPTVDLG